MKKCDACGLHGVGFEPIQVRTTNGAVALCRQCLDDINRKSPLLVEELKACAKVAGDRARECADVLCTEEASICREIEAAILERAPKP